MGGGGAYKRQFTVLCNLRLQYKIYKDEKWNFENIGVHLMKIQPPFKGLGLINSHKSYFRQITNFS